MRIQNRAAAAAAATAIAATATLAGVPAQAAPAGAGASVVGDVLTVTGTNAGDAISIDFSPLDSVVVDLGGGSGTRRFAAGTFHSAVVDLRNGDDQLRTVSGGVLADVPMTVTAGNGDDVVTTGAGGDLLDGGNGDDLLLGGAGTDRLVGANGSDVVNGQVGTDVEVLGNGDDTAAWNPGEGNDAVDGGLGSDTLAFNGSNGDEQMSLSANGRSAVFLRTQGTIRMDLDGVERLDLATFGGVDTVTIGDLSGTEVTTADIDLAGTNGAADTRDDTVLVTGTAGSDAVGVSADGDAVAVDGLPARTSVSGGDPTDVLRVDTSGGDDQVAVSDQARALLDIQVS
jgi:Ca2+-binding RTX toxin-like protein